MKQNQTGSPKLAVCWIWGSPFVWSQSVESMMQLYRPTGYDVQFFRGTGWGPARRHIDACEQAVNWGADWILILGADQVYDPDLLERLISRVEKDGCEVISALVPTRGFLGKYGGRLKPFQPMAARFKSNGVRPINWGVDAVEFVTPADGELVRIDFCGSGCLMFHRDHLLALKRPWFFEDINHQTQIRTANMDCRFVFRLRSEVGAQVWTDTTIRVRHINPFLVDETYSQRFADYAIPGVGPSDICQHQPLVALEA